MNAHALQTQRPVSRLRAAWRAAPIASAVLATALLSLMSGRALGGQVVRPYEVTTQSSDPEVAFPQALRTAIVRATGDRAAPDLAALQPLFAAPRRYVLLFRPAASGGLQVTIDGRSLERAIVAGGAALWPREREVVLVGFPSGPAAAAGIEQLLGATAAERALPIKFAAAPVAADLPPEAALERARAEAADLVLIAQAADVAAASTWRLVSRAGEATLDGDAASVLDAVADRVARASIEFMQQPEAPVLVDVGGVGSLADYSTALRLLAAVPGVRSVSVRELRAGSARFGVLVRGGAGGLVEALAVHPRFAPAAAAAASDALSYDLTPSRTP
jgi:hypothetical protein